MRLDSVSGRLLAAAFLLAIPDASASDVMRLLTNIAPPYQEMVDGELDGTSMRALDCVMDRLHQRYEVGLAPWLRARGQVRQGRIDAVFSVAPDVDAPREANLSLPVALERWVWVTRADGGPTRVAVDDGRRMAAVLGSNQLKWLKSQGVDADGAARSSAQLLRMLAVLMDEAELHIARRDAGIDAAALAASFQRYMPLGVYFSDAFLKENPGFMARFNGEISQCAAGNMSLSAAERRTVTALAREVHGRLLAEPTLTAALQAADRDNAVKSVQQIMSEDQAFQRYRQRPGHAAAQALRDHPLSAVMAGIRGASGGVVSELLLFDPSGVAVAADPLSSDLWQADELKFSMTVPQGPAAVFIDKIAFDQSTSQFSVQVSFSIPGDQAGTAIGGLTVGLNIERALNQR